MCAPAYWSAAFAVLARFICSVQTIDTPASVPYTPAALFMNKNDRDLENKAGADGTGPEEVGVEPEEPSVDPLDRLRGAFHRRGSRIIGASRFGRLLRERREAELRD